MAPQPPPVSDGATLLRMGALARSLPAASSVLDYASRIVLALQPLPGATPVVRDYVRLGPSPRGAQALTLAGSVSALIAGRNHLSYEDVRAVALPALRHRLILTFDAERNGVTADNIVSAIVRDVREDAP
jgi:MoxR-like ATPase